ncbi:MAG: NAD(P)/FAD-dependent oxidoreductase [Hyphomicrobiaceae bacterium]|nr:NAD(P)/FAD-dependent oxidoreductase [Hyphomicrobiaceae bacterium]
MKDAAGQPGEGSPLELDVIIVGAGVGGLYAIHKLRGQGMNVRAFEAGSGVGGTWFWNRYPGCRCDIESMEYSYSFDDDLQQEWHWPERYGTQPEILRYVNHVAERFDLMRDVELNTRVKTAHFDAATGRWTITTDTGVTATAPYIIMATGNLSTPQKPNFPGLDSFKGEWHHTGLWPPEGVDFTGKRAGIIGTGSSGVQSIPHIAQQAKHLTVFQRTANFSLPARNAPLDPDKEQRHKSEYSERRTAAYDTPFGIAGYPRPEKSALEVSEAERNATYEAKWAEGGSISFLYAFTDLLTSKEANDTASEFVRNKIRQTVKDPVTAELLCPNDHPIGTKRLILDTDYYETYNRDNVSLVDARRAPIVEITPTGLRTKDAEYELDAIVFATGFDAMTGAMKEIDISTTSGAQITEKWTGGPRTYLGLMMAGFPNLFMITGPQSPGVKSQMILSCEQHVNWIADCLAYLDRRNLQRIEPTQAAEDMWVAHVADTANQTLYPMANSWYLGSNIPGKPRVFMPYVAGVKTYTREIATVVENGYEGFVLSR